MDASIYGSRRRRNTVAAIASYASAFVGLSWLALILGVLFWKASVVCHCGSSRR